MKKTLILIALLTIYHCCSRATIELIQNLNVMRNSYIFASRLPAHCAKQYKVRADPVGF